MLQAGAYSLCVVSLCAASGSICACLTFLSYVMASVSGQDFSWQRPLLLLNHNAVMKIHCTSDKEIVLL